MNSKERVLTAIGHKEPDRIPRFIFLTPEVSDSLSNILGLDSSDSYALDVELGNDMLLCYRGIGDIPGVYKRKYDEKVPNEFYDRWGIKYREVNYGKDKFRGKYTEMVKHPLADNTDLDKYRIPNPSEEDLTAMADLVEKYGHDYAIIAGVACTIFEASWYLRGLENFMMDLKHNRDFANELMDMVMQYHLEVARKMIAMGADIVWVGDDVGMQSGMYISPQDFRDFLKPRYAHMFNEFRKIKKDIKIAYHSDGYMEPVIPDFIEIGLDILNPVQPSCMNPYEIKKKYGKNLTFWGTIDVQKVMPFGTTAEVIGEVKERIRTVGPDGGFILCSAHCIQPSDRAVDNIFAYYWAANKYSNYPLSV